ncbi:MAG TPA: HIT domain-containing protein [Clostridia bacterium]|nr:HIT domain-containing protein [Clostridia bacterium]
MRDACERDCIFCNIGRHAAPAEYVYEDETVFVIKDRFPKAPVHLLVIPRKHVTRIDALDAEDDTLIVHLFEVIRLIAAKYHLEEGYRVIINSGAGSGQTVPHLHVHIVAGKCLGSREDVAL